MNTVHVFETRHERGSMLRYHRHGIAYVTLVLSGRYTEVHSLSPEAYATGDVIVHGAQEEHSDYFTGEAACLNLEITGFALQEAGAPTSRSDRDVRHAALALTAAYYGSGDVQSAAAALESSLHKFAQKPVARRPDWLEHVLHAFDWTGAEPIRAAAMLAGVHPAHFSRAFTDCLGIPPVAYRQKARLRLACRMVLSSEHSLAAIAAASGFSDQSHLTRTFSQSLGLSPSCFRRTFQS